MASLVATSVCRIERVFADGRREFVTMAGVPWEGPEEKARSRASVMQKEEPDVVFMVQPLAAGDGAHP